jgi:hypothetical protein
MGYYRVFFEDDDDYDPFAAAELRRRPDDHDEPEPQPVIRSDWRQRGSVTLPWGKRIGARLRGILVSRHMIPKDEEPQQS